MAVDIKTMKSGEKQELAAALINDIMSDRKLAPGLAEMIDRKDAEDLFAETLRVEMQREVDGGKPMDLL